jgi:hypothetical protein
MAAPGPDRSPRAPSDDGRGRRGHTRSVVLKCSRPPEHGSGHLQPRPLQHSFRAVLVVGAAVLGALILFFATEGLFLLAHYAHHVQ